MKKKKITISEIFFTFDGITFANVLMSIGFLKELAFYSVGRQSTLYSRYNSQRKDLAEYTW